MLLLWHTLDLKDNKNKLLMLLHGHEGGEAGRGGGWPRSWGEGHARGCGVSRDLQFS